jgi:hypothetical protein
LWGGFVDYVYSLYGILKGVEQDVARHEMDMHFVIDYKIFTSRMVGFTSSLAII